MPKTFWSLFALLVFSGCAICSYDKYSQAQHFSWDIFPEACPRIPAEKFRSRRLAYVLFSYPAAPYSLPWSVSVSGGYCIRRLLGHPGSIWKYLFDRYCFPFLFLSHIWDVYSYTRTSLAILMRPICWFAHKFKPQPSSINRLERLFLAPNIRLIVISLWYIDYKDA